MRALFIYKWLVILTACISIIHIGAQAINTFSKKESDPASLIIKDVSPLFEKTVFPQSIIGLEISSTENNSISLDLLRMAAQYAAAPVLLSPEGIFDTLLLYNPSEISEEQLKSYKIADSSNANWYILIKN